MKVGKVACCVVLVAILVFDPEDHLQISKGCYLHSNN